MRRRQTLLLCVAMMSGAFYSCTARDQDAMFTAAQESGKHGQWLEAAGMYRKLFDEFPSGPYASKALFTIGMIQYEQLKDMHSAAGTFEQVAGRFQESPESPKALMSLGFMFGNDSTVMNDDSAKFYYRTLLEQYPDDQLAVAANGELHILNLPPDERPPATKPFAAPSFKSGTVGNNKSIIKPPSATELAH